MEGLVGWVQFDGAVPTVPDEVISELESRLHRINNSGGYWTRFRPGDRVQVASGMLEGLAEVVEESKSPEARVRVMLNFMGRLVPARVPWSDLRPIRDDLAPVYEARPPRRTRGKGRWVRGFGPRGVADASTSRA
jgi:transcription antitermination factor NusG